MIVGRLLISLFGLQKNGQKVNRIVAATATTNLLEHGLPRHLVLRAIDDEASLTLAAGAIGNRLTLFFSSILMSLMGIVSSLWIIWVLVAVLLFLAGKIEFFAFVFGSKFSGPFFVGIPALGSIVCILLFVLSGAFKMVYGRELFLGTLQCAVNSQSVPDAVGGRLTVITLPDTGSAIRPSNTGNALISAMILDHISAMILQLRHSLPQRPECANVIVDWVATTLGLEKIFSQKSVRAKIVALIAAQAKNSEA
jgi:hypothetical protein